MTDEQSFDEDPQLRALLAQADPARSLTPADPQGLARLLEDTMSPDLDTRPEIQQSTDLRRRGPLAWLVAAAAVAAIAGGGYAAVSSMQDNGTAPQAGPDTAVDPVDDPVVVTLRRPPLFRPSARSRRPRCSAGAEVAFAGTVTAVDGDVVTLDSDRDLRGSERRPRSRSWASSRRAGAGRADRVRGRRHLPRLGHRWSGLRVRLQRRTTPSSQQLYDLAFR